MKVGVVQVDGKIPNLALMQVAAYHAAAGDDVEWFKGLLFGGEYGAVYASKIFAFSELPVLPPDALIGGTGIDFRNQLPAPIAASDPGDAWWLYPECEFHLGFSQKGCRFKCEFCCVKDKEPGRPWSNATIGELLTNPRGADRLMLLDNDFFGGPEWRDRAEEIIDRKLRVCFAQGLNIRILTDEQAAYLARMRFRNTSFGKRQVTFAWDRYKDGVKVKEGIARCKAAGIPGGQMQFFVLIGFKSTPEEDLERVETLRSEGCDPFVMRYDRTDPYQLDFQRWVNQRAAFNTTSWQNYSRSYRRGRWLHGERTALPVLGDAA